MTTTTLITTLALSFNDVLTFGFVALFIVGPWISKAMKKARQPGGPPASGRSTVRHTPSRDLPSATDLALRRQKRLQELAQRRRSAATGQQPDPNNLSMPQRLERQRAKAMYEQRAHKLRQQQTQPQNIQHQPRAVIQQPTQRPRQQQLAQQRLARQQKRMQQRQRAEALRHMTQQRKTAAAKPVQPQSRSKLSRFDTDHDRDTVHRHVPDAPTTTVASTAATHPSRIGHLDAHSLRNAIMLKEILDPPLALRQPSAETNY